MAAYLKPPSSPLTIFISAVSKDLGEHRERIKDLLETYGFRVIVQVDYPKDIHKTLLKKIQADIANSDYVLCLLGHEFGTPLPSHHGLALPNVIKSWTQYEYHLCGDPVTPGKAAHVPVVFFQEPLPAGLAQGDDQARYRQFVYDSYPKDIEKSTFSRFHDLDSLLKRVHAWCDSDLKDYRLRRWQYVKSRYLKARKCAWAADWPLRLTEGSNDPIPTLPEELPVKSDKNEKKAPYIERQRMARLVPREEGEKLKPHLRPEAFIVRGQNQGAFDTGNWATETRDHVVNLLRRPINDADRIARLFVITAGGVGKTTFLKWLEFGLSDETKVAEEDSSLPVRIDAASIPKGTFEDSDRKLLDYVSQVFQAHLAACDEFSRWHVTPEEVSRWLSEERDAGRIVLLFDGLDHVGTGTPPVLIRAQRGDSNWSRCPIVLSGRPYVVLAWNEEDQGTSDKLAARRWDFLRLEEFDKTEQQVFLGKTADGRDWRRELIPPEAHPILSVPRVLDYLNQITDDTALRELHTAAHIYLQSLRGLIYKTIEQQAHPEVVRMGKIREARNDNHPLNVEDQLNYIMRLLGALAYVMTRQEQESTEEPRYRPNFDCLDLTEEVIDAVELRMRRIYGNACPETDCIREDLVFGIRALSTAAATRNRILEDAPRDMMNLPLIWSSKSVQAFFAAYWLAKYADSHRKTANDVTPDTSGDPAELRAWVWSHENTIDELQELNGFLVDMPLSAVCPVSWLEAAQYWFERRNHRPTEMMYRAWERLCGFAGEPIDDWWNSPYESLYVGNRLRHSEKLLPAVERMVREKIQGMAQGILAQFRGELPALLDGGNEIAERFTGFGATGTSVWKTVPTGEFEMGFPPELQGFPRETRLYWQQVLRKVVTISRAKASGLKSPNLEHVKSIASEICVAISKQCNDEKWFRGLQGKRFRDSDVEWLAEVFQPLAEMAFVAKIKSSILWEQYVSSATVVELADPIPDWISRKTATNQEQDAFAINDEILQTATSYAESKGISGPASEAIRLALSVEVYRRLRHSLDPKELDSLGQKIQKLPDEVIGAAAWAKHKIEVRWRRPDETPKESKQAVRSFQIHELPVVHETYGLFAPGHRKTVAGYLREIDPRSQDSVPGDDHPVIFVSWFDAWAFCQWANWSDGGIQYRCRLPHEPEWEFAVRRAARPDGTPEAEPTPTSQPYWWGNLFYPQNDDSDEALAESIVPVDNDTDETRLVEWRWQGHQNEFAHAFGAPGKTRAANASAANGFGLRDLLGNVWEWNANAYLHPLTEQEQARHKSTDTTHNKHDWMYSRKFPAPTQRLSLYDLRAMRGGLWYFLDLLARCSHRFRLEPGDRDYKMGFRVVREPVTHHLQK